MGGDYFDFMGLLGGICEIRWVRVSIMFGVYGYLINVKFLYLILRFFFFWSRLRIDR